MSKRVQLLGHIAEIANQFVGMVRELTVDTDQAELRLHDGVTPGGRRFLDRDSNDNRYQQRSVELDGLLGWEPQERGFTVRLGPSNYRLRSITVNGQNLTIENGNGFLGNPAISLKPTVESDHTWTGVQTYAQQILASGGISGNLVGNSAGTHTGPVVGNVTGNVTGNANGNHTGSFTGDANFSGHGVNFADEQILLAWLEPAVLAAMSLAGLPVGSVVAYAADLGDLPANWFVCDGTNGTPDLRDRFILGAGPTYPADSVGGTTTHAHAVTVDEGGEHTHVGNVGDTALTVAQIPSHRHSAGVAANLSHMFTNGSTPVASPTTHTIDSNSNDGVVESWTSYTGTGGPHTHALALTPGGAHAHSASAAVQNHIPPFYALVYIMKGS